MRPASSPYPPASVVDAPPPAVIDAVIDAARNAAPATLVLVVETAGSTYAQAGGMALFGPGDARTGWLSGGCLEPAIARRAADAGVTQRMGWMEIDTRDDDALLSGAALGCRGRLRLALLPLAAMPDVDAPLQAWRAGRAGLRVSLAGEGVVAIAAGAVRREWRLPTTAPDWDAATAWSLASAPPPELLLCGGGPETPMLLPLLRRLGWRTTLVERRARWTALGALADRHRRDAVDAVLAGSAGFDAALLMHHNFELDLDALIALAPAPVPFVGLLGPVRRREDLFRVVPEALHAALRPRLQSPVGLDLGGRGADAIALSIAAQLQAWRHGRAP